MTETQFTSKLVRALKDHLGPDFVIFKHADGYTAGIPDISISFGQRTLWIEAKLKNNPKIFEPLQIAMLRKMDGHYVIWDTKTRLGCRFSYVIAPDSGQVIPVELRHNFDALVQNILNEVR